MSLMLKVEWRGKSSLEGMFLEVVEDPLKKKK
jgi:hypothetical protein